MAKSNLQKIIEEAGKGYRSFHEAAAALQEDKDNYAAREQLAVLMESITPADRARDTVKAPGFIIDENLRRYNKITRNRLNSAVDGKFDKVLKMLSREQLIDLALGVAPQDVKDKQYEGLREIHKKYSTLVRAIQEKDFGAYIGMVEDKDAKAALAAKVNAMPEKNTLENMAEYAQVLKKDAEKMLKGKSEEYIRGYLTRNYKKSKAEYREGMNVAAGSLVK